jgi:hypothetical protein
MTTHFRRGQIQQIGIILDIGRMISESFPAIIGLRELFAMQRGRVSR